MQPDPVNPLLIQGGMGVGVSGWRLARAVSQAGQLGVVSGTALDLTLARRLQRGDVGGHLRRALAQLPIVGAAERILSRYFVPGGIGRRAPFKTAPVPAVEARSHWLELLIAGNFVEVFLAKEGHSGQVGVNYLEKIQLPTLPSIFGAMLADVDHVLMGAGIPRSIPGVLDRLAEKLSVTLRLEVRGAGSADRHELHFDPAACCPQLTRLKRPRFLAIVSSLTLASMLARKANGRVDGFVVEGPTAGGHNAPPRGQLQLTAEGEPIYGERDVADTAGMQALGLPFWLAGSYGSPQGVAEALRLGAAGVQVGTAFAYCEESDLDAEIKSRVLALSRAGQAVSFTDPVASPTGFPFKVVPLPGTMSDAVAYGHRQRVCDLGYLRHAYLKQDGRIGWRCPAEPVDDYVRKGGDAEDTSGRKCVCNALLANLGLGQIREDGLAEPPLVTSGDEVATVARFLKPGATSYSAGDVVADLLQYVPQDGRDEGSGAAAKQETLSGTRPRGSSVPVR